MARKLPPNTVSVGKPFEVKGIPVVEILRKPYKDKPHIYNLTWVRYPLEAEQIEGKDNNFFHADFGKNQRQDKEYVRKYIRDQFLAYWDVVQLWVPPTSIGDDNDD